MSFLNAAFWKASFLSCCLTSTEATHGLLGTGNGGEGGGREGRVPMGSSSLRCDPQRPKRLSTTARIINVKEVGTCSFSSCAEQSQRQRPEKQLSRNKSAAGRFVQLREPDFTFLYRPLLSSVVMESRPMEHTLSEWSVQPERLQSVASTLPAGVGLVPSCRCWPPPFLLVMASQVPVGVGLVLPVGVGLLSSCWCWPPPFLLVSASSFLLELTSSLPLGADLFCYLAGTQHVMRTTATTIPPFSWERKPAGCRPVVRLASSSCSIPTETAEK